MTAQEIISKTNAFVKQALKGAEGGHDWYHIHRVFVNAQKIATTENVDTLVVALGALLHDIADAKFYDGDETVGPRMATEFLTELGWEETGLERMIRAGYDLLHLLTFFTAGVKEVRAWTFPEGSTAPQAAGKIHTDFEKGFIRAEIVSYDHFVEFNGEQGAKDAGKWRLEGKDYIVKDGDVIHFRFNV